MRDSGGGQPTLYLETTIVSYLTARPSRDIIVLGHQELTRQWWEEERAKYRLFISPFVLEEAAGGDRSAAAKRARVLSDLDLLAPKPEIKDLAEEVRRALALPPKGVADALHLAYTIHYELDYLLTWNCTHLANGRNLRRLADFVTSEGLWLPVVCTPLEMVKERKVQ